MTRTGFLLVCVLLYVHTAFAETIYISARTGNDIHPGTSQQPLRTLQEASRRVNANTKKEATTIIISEGVYLLTETVLFNNNKYSPANRLTIKAEIMPDDTKWNPQNMPILVAAAPVVPDGDGEIAKGLDIEVSYATIEGLRFSGITEYYYIDGKHNRRTYPLWRDGDALEDLLVTQCLFTGDVDIAPVRVGAIARGHGFVIDHCVFYQCQNPVVFWNASGGNSRNNAMRYCIVYGCYYSGVWTTQHTGDDLEFHHNIIANSGTAWIREGGLHRYQVNDCIFTLNANQLSTVNNNTSPFGFLQLQNVRLSGMVEIEKDQSRRNYLQLKARSFGTDLGAGLFKN